MPSAQIEATDEVVEAHVEELDEPLDSRIEKELDKMNTSAFLINKLENDLGMAQKRFKALYEDCMAKLNTSVSKLGLYIHRAMPYYDCRLKAKEAQERHREAHAEYERAASEKYTTREMVELAEQGYDAEKAKCNMAWQEMLNHATNKLLLAESTTLSREVGLQKATKFLDEAQRDVQRQYKMNKRAVSKSKPYFEMKSKFHQILEQQRHVITKIETDFSSAKSVYAKSMSNLERISEEIHTRRQSQAHITIPQNVSSHEIIPDNNNTLSEGMNGMEESFSEGTSSETNTSTLTAANSIHNYPSPPSSESSPTQSLTRSPEHSTETESDEESDESDGSLGSPVKRRSASCRESSASSHSPPTKTRSMSFPTSPPELSDESLNSDRELNRSDSSILDDESLDNAISQKYFDTESYSQTEEVLSVCEKSLPHENIDVLPSRLSGYQKRFTLKRRTSVLSPDGHSLVLSTGGRTSTVQLDDILTLMDMDMEEHDV